MLIDWKPGGALPNYRFVVVGAGPAGLFLAQELAQSGRVLVVEAGGRPSNDDAGSGYYDLVSEGVPYPSLGTRLSTFGGTSNHWGGHSHPFFQAIFDDRPGFGSWPIAYEEYATYLDRACEFLNLRPFRPSLSKTSIETGILSDYRDLGVVHFQFSSPILRLGEPEWVARFRVDKDIDVLLDTRVVDLELDGNRVASIQLRHRPSGEGLSLPVRDLVLAAGGIENARLLLWGGRKYPLGNPLAGGPGELTGKYFTEKFYFSPVEIFVDARADLSGTAKRHDGSDHLGWVVSDPFRAAHDLPRFVVFPQDADVPPPDPYLEHVEPYYLGQSASYRRLVPDFQAEQTPNDQSFVALADALDDDGVAKPLLHWEISAEDIKGARRAAMQFCGLLNQKGFAKARFIHQFTMPEWDPLILSHAGHHLGTTRMAGSPSDGVVDTNCQVFGVSNLFIAGCSVFPSSDFVNPTLNLIALAARLADHLTRR